MKYTYKTTMVLGGLLLSVQAAAQTATVETSAQAAPTVFVVLDSSASMERLPDSADLPRCATWDGTNVRPPDGLSFREWMDSFPQMSRQGLAASVLGGTIPNYYCVQDLRDVDQRRGTLLAFRDDDVDVNGATPTQGWPHMNVCSVQDVRPFLGPVPNPEVDCDPAVVASVQSSESGILDGANGDELNFAFGSYDSDPGASPFAQGLWSYGDGWATDINNQGLRNLRASNGALIQPFLTGYGVDNPQGREQVNENIQRAILNSVPYGATPLGAAFEDVGWFYNNDYTVMAPGDPADSGMGTVFEPYEAAGQCVYEGYDLLGGLVTGLLGEACVDASDCFCPGLLVSCSNVVCERPPGHCSIDGSPCSDDAECDGSLGGQTCLTSVVGMDPYRECRPRNLVVVTDGVDSFEACYNAQCDHVEGLECATDELCTDSGYCSCHVDDDCTGPLRCDALERACERTADVCAVDDDCPITHNSCVAGSCSITGETCSGTTSCPLVSNRCLIAEGLCRPQGCDLDTYPDPIERAQRLHDEDGVEVYVIGYGVGGRCVDDRSTTCTSGEECTSGVCDIEGIASEIACAGDGGGADCRGPYIAQGNGASLAAQFQAVLNSILGGETSRTAGVTTAQTYDFRDGAAAGDDGTTTWMGAYRFRAATDISADSLYWSGHLYRDEFVCSPTADAGAAELTYAATVDLSRDLFDNGVQTSANRTILTADQQLHTCHLGEGSAESPLKPFWGEDLVPETVLTWRPQDVVSACCMDAAPGECTTMAEECLKLLEPNVGTHAERTDWVGPTGGSDEPTCMSELLVQRATTGFFGDIERSAESLPENRPCNDATDCANPFNEQCNGGFCALRQAPLEHRLVSWLRGWRIGEDIGAETPEVGGLFPGLARESVMPALYHSQPVFVGGPYEQYPIEGWADFQRQPIVGAGTYANSGRARDTVLEREGVLYVSALDGMIHAFSAEDGRELWAFLPNAIAHRMPEMLTRGQGEAVDGSPVVQNMMTSRNLTTGVNKWATILVTGFRGGGRGYVALDVTDPQRPRFLWELDAELDPAMGLTYGAPLLGNVVINDCSAFGAGERCIRGVAVLGGGAGLDGLASQDFSITGRVVYVVDIETGIVIRRIDHLRSGDWIDVPVTGSVSGANTAPGRLLSRAYVGDAAGRLLRINLSSDNPASWSADVFFDPRVPLETCECGESHAECLDWSRVCTSGERPDRAESGEYQGEPFCGGSIDPTGNGGADNHLPGNSFHPGCELGPISYAPSVVMDGQGDYVVTYALGDTDDLQSTGATNVVVSLGDRTQINGLTGALLEDDIGVSPSELNWMVILDNNEKVTAAPFIYDRGIYFATYIPSEDFCTIGSPRIYGFRWMGQFLRNEATGEDIGPEGSIVFSSDLVQSHRAAVADSESMPGILRELDTTGTAEDRNLYRYYDWTTQDADGNGVLPEQGTIFGLRVEVIPSCARRQVFRPGDELDTSPGSPPPEPEVGLVPYYNTGGSPGNGTGPSTPAEIGTMATGLPVGNDDDSQANRVRSFSWGVAVE